MNESARCLFRRLSTSRNCWRLAIQSSRSWRRFLKWHRVKHRKLRHFAILSIASGEDKWFCRFLPQSDHWLRHWCGRGSALKIRKSQSQRINHNINCDQFLSIGFLALLLTAVSVSYASFVGIV